MASLSAPPTLPRASPVVVGAAEWRRTPGTARAAQVIRRVLGWGQCRTEAGIGKILEADVSASGWAWWL